MNLDTYLYFNENVGYLQRFSHIARTNRKTTGCAAVFRLHSIVFSDL